MDTLQHVDISIDYSYGGCHGEIDKYSKRRLKEWIDDRIEVNDIDKIYKKVLDLIHDIRKNKKIKYMAYISNLDVEDEFQGRGYGSKLINKWMKGSKSQLIMLSAMTDNKQRRGFKLQKFYELHGFHKICRIGGGHFMVKVSKK